jgi:peptidoglycan/LPS O-acetylase OafA/YrhL
MTNAEASETKPSRRILRRIGAVLAGFLVVAILDTSIDAILHATGVYPPLFQPMKTSLWLLAIGYRTVDGITGGYVVARLAPDRPVAHALALGVIGVLLSAGAVVATWSKGPEFGPKWYPLTLVAIALPCALIGGLLRARQLQAERSGETKRR